jgi:6-pyruvoyltetrahydropterin/6-carboxytetrahydropterin synthase
MYYLEAEQSFDAAHFLKGYQGKCRNLHGHRWRVLAQIQGDTLQQGGSQDGMLRDFGDLKADLKAITDPLDHTFLVETGSLQPETQAALEAEGFPMVFFPFRTTAENLARYVYDHLVAQGYTLSAVTVYETPTNCARYTGDGEA